MSKIAFFYVPMVVCFLSCMVSAQTRCPIDDTGYDVLAAVLFPNDPEMPDPAKPDPGREAQRSLEIVRLDGFHGSSYLLRSETLTSSISKGSDGHLAEDFNRKNAGSCVLDRSKLLARVPEGGHVEFRDASNPRPLGALQILSGSEIATLSLPGFSKNGAAAVVEVDMKAGPEMGTRYLVYLQKSRKSGKWMLIGADRIRLY